MKNLLVKERYITVILYLWRPMNDLDEFAYLVNHLEDVLQIVEHEEEHTVSSNEYFPCKGKDVFKSITDAKAYLRRWLWGAYWNEKTSCTVTVQLEHSVEEAPSGCFINEEIINVLQY